MKLTDALYGEVEITEPVLQELIYSQAIQRLKGIHQGGANYLVNNDWNVTRFDHSVGVMLLIRLLDGSIEEQIAGLLHDVSHTAFSHVADYVFEHESEDYHEMIFDEVVGNSDIPKILARYQIDYNKTADHANWPLLEQPAPALCADRIDYTLRDMHEYGHISLAEVQAFLSDMTVVKGHIHLQDISIAEWFTETYYKEVIDFFMHPLSVYANHSLAQCLKQVLQKKIITPSDFLGTDQALLNMIQDSSATDVWNTIQKISPEATVRNNPSNYDFHKKHKMRTIDPLILENSQSIRASCVSKKVEMMTQQAFEKSERGVYIEIL